jgi:hypothetical protein
MFELEWRHLQFSQRLFLGEMGTKQFKGVAEKHDFRSIQRKIPQVSDFAKKWDSNPTPWGYCGGHCEKVCSKFFAKIGFRVEKHDFRKNPRGFLQNSPD